MLRFVSLRLLIDISGIDLNTNWGYMFQSGTSSACSDAFPGTEAFEAYETRAVANYLINGTEWHGEKERTIPRKVRAFVDLHSYGQLCELGLRSLSKCSM